MNKVLTVQECDATMIQKRINAGNKILLTILPTTYKLIIAVSTPSTLALSADLPLFV